MLDRHARDTVRTACATLTLLPCYDALARADVRVEDLALDGSSLRTTGRSYDVPVECRRALLRQLVHALVAGQTPRQQLLSLDGTRMPASALGSIADSA